MYKIYSYPYALITKTTNNNMSVFLQARPFAIPLKFQPRMASSLISAQLCWIRAMHTLQSLEHDQALNMMRDLMDVIQKFEKDVCPTCAQPVTMTVLL